VFTHQDGEASCAICLDQRMTSVLPDYSTSCMPACMVASGLHLGTYGCKLYPSYREYGNTLYTSMIWSLLKLQFGSSPCSSSYSALIQLLAATNSSPWSSSNLTSGPGSHSSSAPAQNAILAPSPSGTATVILPQLRMPPQAFSASSLGSISSPGHAQAIFHRSGPCSDLVPAQAPTQL